MPRELHVSIELNGTGHHPSASLTAAHWTDLIGLAEQGALDFVAVGDTLTHRCSRRGKGRAGAAPVRRPAPPRRPIRQSTEPAR
ncbi:hypothetical protein OG252_01260 [Streptomyces sp. NBC_01352]|uniref:hypothetical protein n=1 Tax=Streptomyces sp. NBC_01352 TaxID=2903834 RepID=UPI002E30AF83|nr:hypothetical protein [Streptomyces sp. NBC_01352]